MQQQDMGDGDGQDASLRSFEGVCCVGKLPSSPLGTSRNLGSSVGVRGRNRAPAPTRRVYVPRRPIYMCKLVRDGFEKSCSGVRSGPHVLVRVCPLAQRRPQIPAPAAARKCSLFECAKLKRGPSKNRCSGVGSGPHSLVGVGGRGGHCRVAVASGLHWVRT